VSLLFASLCYFIITRPRIFNIIFTFVFFFHFVYSVFYIVLCIVFFLYGCPFPIFVQVYQPLPPGGNPTAVNKYHILSLPYTYIMFRNSTHTIVMQCTRAIYSSYTLRFLYSKSLVLQWPAYFARWRSGDTHTQRSLRTHHQTFSVSFRNVQCLRSSDVLPAQ
jgi:hypothetical protein